MASQGQDYTFDQAGITFGIALDLGTHYNRVGIYANCYYHFDYAQFNFNPRYYYTFKSLGSRQRGNEWQIKLGAVGAFGPLGTDENHFLSPVGNQTSRVYSVAYAYNIYLDQFRTSQRSGTIGFQLHKWSVYTENDILAGKGLDRFRTGAFHIGYDVDSSRLGVGVKLWTGESHNDQTTIYKDSSYRNPNGYKDLSNAPYGKQSHGILHLQWQQKVDYGQELYAATGLDSEQFRHLFQNQLIHGLFSSVPDYPMLDRNGQPYLKKEGQLRKKDALFVAFGNSPSVLY